MMQTCKWKLAAELQTSLQGWHWETKLSQRDLVVIGRETEEILIGTYAYWFISLCDPRTRHTFLQFADIHIMYGGFVGNNVTAVVHCAVEGTQLVIALWIQERVDGWTLVLASDKSVSPLSIWNIMSDRLRQYSSAMPLWRSALHISTFYSSAVTDQ